jgi:hypothetical protein
MKKLLALAVLVLSLLVLPLSAFAKEASWYKCFKGKISGYPVTFQLHKYTDQVTGYYYYDKYMMPLVVYGSSKGDSLNLAAYINSNVTEHFMGILKNGVYSGHWSLGGDSSDLDFSMKEDAKLSAMFEFVYVKGEKDLFRNFEKSPDATYLEASVWPTTEYPNYRFIRKSICEEKKISTRLVELEPKLKDNMRDFFANYMKEYESITTKEIEDMGWTSMYNVAEDDVLGITYYDKNLFITSRFMYAYTGGAHGNYSTGYNVYDLKNSEKLALSNVLTDEGIKNLPDLLEKNFRMQNQVPETQSLQEFGLFTDTIHVTENFLITPGCMMFCYVPYEIGPYAMGEARIYLPINEVEKYLKPRAKELLK